MVNLSANGAGESVPSPLEITSHSLADHLEGADHAAGHGAKQRHVGVDECCDCSQAAFDHLKECRPILLSIEHLRENVDDRLQRRQQRIHQLHLEALRSEAQLRDAVVENLRALRELIAQLVIELIKRLATTVQHGDQLNARLAKQRHGRGSFLRTIGHISEAISDLAEGFVCAFECAVFSLDCDAELLEALRQLFVAFGR